MGGTGPQEGKQLKKIELNLRYYLSLYKGQKQSYYSTPPTLVQLCNLFLAFCQYYLIHPL